MSISAGKTSKRLAGALLAAALVALGGCTAMQIGPEIRAETSAKALKLAPGEGMLAVKVAINRSQIDPQFRKFNALVLRDEKNEQEYVLQDRADPLAPHTLFAGSLPPGTYKIRFIESRINNAMVEGWFRPDVKDRFPSFTIAPGRLTDLGNIVYIRAHFPATTSRHALGHVDTPYDQASDLRQFAPAVAAKLGAQPALGWNPDPRLDKLQQQFEAMRALSMQTNAPARLADGTLMFGEAFGRIAVRKPGGDWESLQTPAALPIRSVHALDDGALLAGSDAGILLIRRARGSSWEPLALPVDEASVIDIGPLPGTDQLLVVLQAPDRFIGLSTSRTNPGQWTEQFSRPRVLFRLPGADAQGAVLRAGERLVFASGSRIARQETMTWDSQARSWKHAALDSDGLPLTWATLADGGLVRFEAIPLSRDRFFYHSVDGGAHWEKRGLLLSSWGPLLFESDKVGYVICSAGSLEFEFPESVKTPSVLWRTEDTGRTWTQVGVAPAFPRRLTSLGAPGHLGYTSDDGRFFSSADGGKSWKLEQQVP